MLNDVQFKRLLDKLIRLQETLEPYVFTKQKQLDVKYFQTSEQLYNIPENVEYKSIQKGQKWGGEGVYGWFKSEYIVDEKLAGQPIYIMPKLGGYEAMLWVDGQPFGTFATKIVATGHGNHYCDMVCKSPKSNEKINIDIEFYAGHYIIGCFPFETARKHDFTFEFDSFYICTKNQDILDFIFDIRALIQLYNKMDKNSFRRGDLVNCLTEVHKIVYYDPQNCDEKIWREALKQAREIMKPYLEMKNSNSAPNAGIIGHSHMDTAWLWHIPETIKKCARTFANQLNLMSQYDEYTFIQSSAYHLEMIRRYYPELFERIKKEVANGRYEPNGGVWVECDCNITSGESIIRQFLWGQKYTQKHFNFTSNSFWLPDTFGYSAAIPQIMKGCDVDYFLTTKLSWNDTNTFPYDTFYWEGIDGSNVFCHFNTTHSWPDPEHLITSLEGRGDNENYLKNKNVAKERLIAYGFGDGGGGPQFEMVEMAKRCRDLDGCPKAEHTTVGKFMDNLKDVAIEPPVYSGELYLELHRGTLTNHHTIKRNNRKAEYSLRDLEIFTVENAVANNAVASDENIRPLMETLLVNQFHDILPGTCIAKAHKQSHEDMAKLQQDTKNEIKNQLTINKDENKATVINRLSFDVLDVVYFDYSGKIVKGDFKQQVVTDLNGNKKLAVYGIKLGSFDNEIVEFVDGNLSINSKFNYSGNKLSTPFAEIEFNEKGYISSFVDKNNNRQLKGKGFALNTLLIAEDVSLQWDNWDIDADLQMKFKDSATMLSREVVSNGEVEIRIRTKYQLTEKSTLTQDTIFYAHTPRVDFDTVMDWQDEHRFLKAGFDTTILSRQARHDIQFGYVQKPTTRNTNVEQAMFEVVQHKYTDLSETKYGIAILNDCKYGISVEGGDMRLSLHKGGNRPDENGDKGIHYCKYSFLPHNEFSTNNVIKPSYIFNCPPMVVDGEVNIKFLASVDCDNVIIETIKPCEDNQKGFIIRLYETEGTFANANIKLNFNPTEIYETNMLEVEQQKLIYNNGFDLEFKPFEIKTILIKY